MDVLLWTSATFLWALKWTFIFDLRWHFREMLGVCELLKACQLMCCRRYAPECFGNWNRPLFHKQCRSWCLYTQFKQGSTTKNHLKIPSARRVAWSKFIMTNPRTLGSILQNWVVQVTWCLELLHPWFTLCKNVWRPKYQ